MVGGGPGGATTAALLSKAGHEVVLLEKEHHPRHQIGESLLPSTIHGVCRLSGAWEAVHEAGFVRKAGGTFRWGRHKEPWSFSFSTTTLADADYAFQVERMRFDEILFENARRQGAQAFEGVAVVDALTSDGRVVGVIARDESGEELEIRAAHVIDASGHSSRIARHVGSKKYSEFFQNVAVYGYFEGADRAPAPRQGNIVSSAFEHGWCWFIPLSDTLTSVGAVVDRRHAARIGEDREAALMEFLQQCPVVSEYLKPATRVTEGVYGEVRVRKDWSYLTDRLARPGMLLVGDSACFVDPVFSSGVHLATYGAVLAARTVNTLLTGQIDEAECLREFERRYRREFSVWYEFLVAFFDMDQEWDNYFWAARTLLNTQERGNEAFIRLVAGGGTVPGEFFGRAGLGAEFERMVPVLAGDQPELLDDPETMRLNESRVRESRTLISGDPTPLFEDGLGVSADGLTWARTAMTTAP